MNTIIKRTLNPLLKASALTVVGLGIALNAGTTEAQAGNAAKTAFWVGAGVLTAVAITEAARRHHRGPEPRWHRGHRRHYVAPPVRHRRVVTRQYYDSEDAMEIQEALNTLGYDAGVVDGVIGSQTIAAIRTFQTEIDESATGYLTETQKAVLIDRAEQVDDADDVADLEDDGTDSDG